MTPNEKLFILTRRFQADLKIEVIESESQWDTTYYQIVIFLESCVLEDLETREDKKDFLRDGIASCLSAKHSVVADSFGEAVDQFFDFCTDCNYI